MKSFPHYTLDNILNYCIHQEALQIAATYSPVHRTSPAAPQSSSAWPLTSCITTLYLRNSPYKILLPPPNWPTFQLNKHAFMDDHPPPSSSIPFPYFRSVALEVTADWPCLIQICFWPHSSIFTLVLCQVEVEV